MEQKLKAIYCGHVERERKSDKKKFWLAKFHLPSEQCYVEVFQQSLPDLKEGAEYLLICKIDFANNKYFLSVA